jgi:hypothetical protein
MSRRCVFIGIGSLYPSESFSKKGTKDSGREQAKHIGGK